MKAFLEKLLLQSWGSPELVPDVAHKVETQTAVYGGEYAPMTSLLWCVSSLAIIYFFMYSVLLIVRLLGQLIPRYEGSILEGLMNKAELTLEFFPMTCVLFLAMQMQAIHASGGREEPAKWLLTCMEVATASLLLQTLLSVVLPALMVDSAAVDEEYIGDVGFVGGTQMIAEARTNVSSGEHRKVVRGSLMGLGVLCNYVAFIALQGSCACICFAVMKKHCEMWKDFSPLHPNPALSPAVSCTVNLTVLFFLVRFLLAVVRIWDDVATPKNAARKRACRSKFSEVLKLAANTVFFAPMLCVLFIAAQVRAVQVGSPVQPWAHAAFHVCTIGMIVQTVLSIALPMTSPCLGIDAKVGTKWMDGDIQFAAKDSDDRPFLNLSLVALRYLPILLVCGGFSVVIASILSNCSADGSTTPPVPPATLCTIALTVQFFIVYLGLRIAVSIRQATHGDRGDGGVLVNTLYAAIATVHFCPMLAILYVALRMRSQQVTLHGDPQEWAQYCMYLTTGAVFVQFLVCLVIGVVTGSPPEVAYETETFRVQRDGSKAAGGSAAIIDKVIIAVQGVSLVLLYGGAFAVCVALYTITPDAVSYF
mmetsp:Transcript_10578/g.17304  ORF Transcript_10578/g.17304 Transcript_10578/m.17304 type:complete len:591 (+) Transcript_10578:158-1930(+)|eukprot:CAMPEP_0169084170 /NCGR_PEP_ID=MMETSP1015-20121227/12475_1 /TAXON_ID=342587 /ORGANISM="Karlodinium micrum, Strain CCMP2283" /LENGTH=590 /DNA_ID=CAMNT_0009144155 /DNA_START=120 /DNA_END=1892 /DNA_ORIENTATION=-